MNEPSNVLYSLHIFSHMHLSFQKMAESTTLLLELRSPQQVMEGLLSLVVVDEVRSSPYFQKNLIRSLEKNTLEVLLYLLFKKLDPFALSFG